jgi:Zn-dependent protease
MFDGDIQRFLLNIVLAVPGFLLAITVHEFSHGYIAYRFGDPTAKNAGRLTLNPVSHLDPMGTVALLLTQMTGWAKPVPVNPRYLRNPLRDMLWISPAGRAANILAAVGLGVVVYALAFFFAGWPPGAVGKFILQPLVPILAIAIQINLGLAIFNLIPVPPLDGFSILTGLVPRETAYQLEKLEPYGFLILIGLILTGVTRYIIVPPILFLYSPLMPPIIFLRSLTPGGI